MDVSIQTPTNSPCTNLALSLSDNCLGRVCDKRQMGTSSGGKSTCYTLLYGHSFDKKNFTGQSSSQRCICHPASLLVFCKTCKLFWAFPHLFARTLSGDSDVPSFQPVASIQVLFFRTLGSMKHSGRSGCKICCTARSMQDMFKHIYYICYISVLFSPAHPHRS